MESVWLPAGTTGDFTVTVRASNIPGDGVPNFGDGTDQDFALEIYNERPVPSQDGFKWWCWLLIVLGILLLFWVVLVLRKRA